MIARYSSGLVNCFKRGLRRNCFEMMVTVCNYFFCEAFVNAAQFYLSLFNNKLLRIENVGKG